MHSKLILKVLASAIRSYYMKTEVKLLIFNWKDNAPAAYDTLNELATALADGANYAAKFRTS